MLALRLRVLEDRCVMAATLLQLLGTELNRSDFEKARTDFVRLLEQYGPFSQVLWITCAKS
jgi:hypothetical protein